jgi:hypothetical protein
MSAARASPQHPILVLGVRVPVEVRGILFGRTSLSETGEKWGGQKGKQKCVFRVVDGYGIGCRVLLVR